MREDSVARRDDVKRAVPGPASPRLYVLVLGLVFLLALAARSIGLGGAVTEDEDQWVWRAGTFATGLATHDWIRTYLTGHPGVTVMWLTTLTLGVDGARPFDHPIGGPDVTVIPGFLPALDRARVPFAGIQAGLVVVAAALAGRVLGRPTGLIAGLLLALEPFWAGVGPIVGMDGLLTGCLSVALLSWLVGLGFGIGDPPTTRRRIGWAALAGLAFGFAFLSKTTVLLAGPVFPATALVAAWLAWREAGAVRSARRCWLTLASMLALVGLVAGLTVWLVWPAAWFHPVLAVVRSLTFSARLGGEPHGPGNFMLGEFVDDPGPLFYPIALMLRIGPGTTVGLMLLFVVGAPPRTQRVAWSLVGFAALFLVLLSASPKKVDRYLLPILPSLGILAALGWTVAARELSEWVRRRRGSPTRPAGAMEEGAIHCAPTRSCLIGAQFIAPTFSAPACIILAVVLAFALQAWPLAQAGRYPLAAYNPLVGGVRAAERAIPVGWGDGLDVAGDQVRELAGGRTVVTSIWGPQRVSFGAHAPGPVVSDRAISGADFYVDYIDARQRGVVPRQVANRAPDAVVTIGGVDYARVYRLR